MYEYKPNSHKYKEEQDNEPVEKKKIDKVVTGTVKTKKKSGLAKLSDIFIKEDVNSIGEYIVKDIIIPGVRDIIYNIGTGALDMFCYGGSGQGNKRSTNASKVSYRAFYDKKEPVKYSSNKTTSGYSYDNIILETRGEAEEVLYCMNEIIEEYDGIVTVADLYDLVGITDKYTDHKYGWTNLRNAKVERVRDGYMLKLPKVLPID